MKTYRFTETYIGYCEPGYAYISSDEKKWINAIKKLAESHSECEIMREPETNNGIIYARFPQRWVKIRPPRKVSLTDEERLNLGKKLCEMRRLKENADEDD